MSDLNVKGMKLADGVVETIVSIAVKDVEGVAAVGTSAPSGLLSAFQQKADTSGVVATSEDGNDLHIAIHVDVYYGYKLPKIAQDIREAVADALETQVGVKADSVDVYIDGLRFNQE